MKKISAVLVLLLTTAAMFGQVAVNVGTTVINSSPYRYGRNMGVCDTYASGQYYKNALGCQNVGNEPFTQIQIWQIQTGATLSTTQVQSNINNANYDGVPVNFWAGGTIDIMSTTAAAGSDVLCSQTITSNTVAASSPNGPVYTFPACGTAPVAGNLFRLTQSIPGTASAQYFCSGSGSCSFQTADLCASCGTQTMKWDATAGSLTGQWIFDNTAQNEFRLINGGTWTYSHWAKVASGTATLTVGMSRSGGFTCGNYTESLTTTWTQYTHTCTPTETGTGTPQQWTIHWSVPSGAVVLTDNEDFEKTSGNDTTNTSMFQDEFVHGWQQYVASSTTSAAKNAPCRYGPHPAANTLANLEDASIFNRTITTPGEHGYDGTGAFPAVGFAQFLQFAQVVGCTPYFIYPITSSTAEATAFITWLHTNGWDTAFPEIDVEFGNENWNQGTFAGIALGYRSGTTDFYQDYMLRSGQIYSAMRAQETALGVTNIKHMVGTQTAAPPVSSTVIGNAKADRVLVNGYTQIGPVNDYTTTAALWTPALSQVYNMTHDSSNVDGFYQSKLDIAAMNVCGASGTTACEVGVYEQNNSTYTGSITQTTLDGFVDGAGYGTITAHQFLENLQFGVPFQNLFAAQQYYFVGNGFNAHIFGDVVDCGGATAHLNGTDCTFRPQGLGAQIANRAVIGPMVQTTLTSPDACNQAASSNGVNATTKPCEFAYAFTNGTNRTLALVNLDPSTAHTVNFAGTNAPVSGTTVTSTVLAGTNITDKNEAANLAATNAVPAAVVLATSTLSSFDPSAALSLPPASTTLLSYAIGGPMNQVYVQNEANGVDNGYPVALLPGSEWRTYAQPVYEQNSLTAWTSDGTTTTFTNSGTNALAVGDGVKIRDYPSVSDNFCKVTAVLSATQFQTGPAWCSSSGAAYLAAGSGSATPAFYWKTEGAGMDPTGTWEIIDHGTSAGRYMLRNATKTAVGGGTPCANPDLHTSTCYVNHPVLSNAASSAVWIEVDPTLVPTCGRTGSIQTSDLVLTSDYMFTVKFTPNQNTGFSGTKEYILCQEGAGSGKLAAVDIGGGYEQVYKGSQYPVYAEVVGNADQYIIWSITPDAGSGGDASLTTFPAPTGDAFVQNSGTLPEVVFKPGTVTTGYTIKACSDADPTACVSRRRWVSGSTPPSANPNLVGQAPCDVDPVMTAAGGTTYDIGPGQTYPDFTTVPFWSFTWGSTFRFHGESAAAGSPTTLANYFEIYIPTNYTSFSSDLVTPSFYLCGIPNSAGEIPWIDGDNAIASTHIESNTGLGNLLAIDGILGTVNPGALPSPDLYPGHPQAIHNFGIANIGFKNNRPGFFYYPPGQTSGAQDAWGLGSAIRPFAVSDYSVVGVFVDNTSEGTISDCNAQAGWARGCTMHSMWRQNHFRGYGVDPNSTEHAVYLQDFWSIATGNIEDGSLSGAATAGFSMRATSGIYAGNRVVCLPGYNCPNGFGGDSEVQDAAYYFDINRAFGPTAAWDGNCGDGTAQYPFCSDTLYPGLPLGDVSTYAAFEDHHFRSLYMMGNALQSPNATSAGCGMSIAQTHGDNGLEMQHNLYSWYNLVDCGRAENLQGASMFEDVRPTQAPTGDSVQPIDWPAANFGNSSYWWNDNTGSSGYRSSFGRGTAHALFSNNMFHVNQFDPTQTGIPLAYGNDAFNASQYGLYQGTYVDEFTGMAPVEGKQGGWTTANFLTSPAKQYDTTTLKPISGSAFIGAAAPLPYPDLLYAPMFNAVDAAAVVTRRLYPTTIGPYDQITVQGVTGTVIGSGRFYGTGTAH